MIERFHEVERAAAENGLSFAEAMRLLAGADVAARRQPRRPTPTGPRYGRSLAGGDVEGIAQSGRIGAKSTPALR